MLSLESQFTIWFELGCRVALARARLGVASCEVVFIRGSSFAEQSDVSISRWFDNAQKRSCYIMS